MAPSIRASSLVARLRRRRWLRTWERWGPAQCAVLTAATIVGADPNTLAAVLQETLHRRVTSETILSRAEIMAGLRGSGRGVPAPRVG